MSLIITAALVALAALVIWTVGPVVGRLGGALLVVTALVSTVHSGPSLGAARLLAIGAIVWMAGHLLTAYKTRTWRSRLAEAIAARTPLRYIDPVHGRSPRGARRTSRPGRAQAPTWPAAPVDDFAAWERELTGDARPAAPVAPMRPSAGSVYGKRAAKVATTLAVRKVPGARAARSAWRLLR
ncbi:hypothetical protein [Rhodococcus zopfii]|uniref:hypothetical protein n=1 Tax=Rhodococcus zopfii TaxID=43772 RepID=UPI0009353860|nr:hypothetical protein [Rhodococcus zopfii]